MLAQFIQCSPERGRVAKQWCDVPEEDPRLGEVGHVADVISQVHAAILAVYATNPSCGHAFPSSASDGTPSQRSITVA